MPTHAETRRVPYTPEQIFDLVADIERYPQFLPWCIAARVRERAGNVLLADLVIGFKMIRERYTSRVTLDRPRRIDVAYTEGPFRALANHWVFEPSPDGGCVIDFYVDFEFRGRLLDKLMGPLFHEAVRRMVAAFEARAEALYGPKAKGPAP
ncbi:MAG: type II toxin-antitoxin system RatA family toxin [Alphaproteobacteria bacterium]